VILLEGEDDFLKEKAKKLPTEVIKGSHWLPADMERRLNDYNMANSINNFRNDDPDSFPLIRFF
jgi:hypothetical protein